MGADQPTNHFSHSDAQNFILSRKDLIKGSRLPDHDNDDDDDENITINIPRTLKPIKMKVESFSPPDLDDRTAYVDDEDRDDGLLTPTGEQHKIPENLLCPPAPRKLRRPSKRRRTVDVGGVQRAMRLVEVSHEEIELLFPRRDLHLHHRHRPGNIKKVNKANFTTLMSFR